MGPLSWGASMQWQASELVASLWGFHCGDYGQAGSQENQL